MNLSSWQYNKSGMMKNCILFFAWKLVIASVLISCKSNDRVNDAEVLRIVCNDDPVSVELYELIDSIQCVALDTSDSCLLGEIINVKECDGYYFVRDNLGLYVFDDKGKFIKEISQKGNGNKEYVYLDNFFLDKERNLVGLICNSSRKIMFFTYNGIYHSTVRMKEEDCGISHIIQCPNQGLIAYYPMPNDFKDVSFEYKEAQIRGDSLETSPLFPMKKLTTKNVYYEFFSHPMAIYKDTCLLLSVLSYDLHACRNGIVESTYQFDLYKELPNKSEQEEFASENFYDVIEKIKASGRSIGFTGIQSNDDYVFLSVNDENVLIWDGTQVFLIKNIYDGMQKHYFFNIVLSGGCSDENIGFYNAEFLCNLKEKMPLRNSVLNQIVASIEESDNPVLYRFAFKKNLISRLKKKYGQQ